MRADGNFRAIGAVEGYKSVFLVKLRDLIILIEKARKFHFDLLRRERIWINLRANAVIKIKKRISRLRFRGGRRQQKAVLP